MLAELARQGGFAGPRLPLHQYHDWRRPHGGVPVGRCNAAARCSILHQVRRAGFAGTREFGSLGITANVINPGATDTGWMSQEQMREFASRIPLGRVSTPSDCAHLVRFLCSADGGWITGQLIHSNGDLHFTSDVAQQFACYYVPLMGTRRRYPNLLPELGKHLAPLDFRRRHAQRIHVRSRQQVRPSDPLQGNMPTRGSWSALSLPTGCLHWTDR
jgi:hypothetical protein